MIETKNSRLNIIFTLWFLVVALLPLFVVTFFFNTRLTRQAENMIDRQLANAGRHKIARFNDYVFHGFQRLQTAYDAISRQESIDLISDNALAVRLAELELARKRGIVLINRGGAVVHPGGDSEADHGIRAWLAESSPAEPRFALRENTVVFAYPLPSSRGWLVSQESIQGLEQVLHEDLNDTAYTGRTALLGSISDLGKTADFFLMDSEARLRSGALVLNAPYGARVESPALISWLAHDRNNEKRGIVSIGARTVSAYARRFDSFGTTLVFVATIDVAEITDRMRSEQREFTILYIFSLIILLFLLYVFVGTMSRFLIKPIVGTISGLMASGFKIRDSIAATESIMDAEEQAARKLEENSRAQMKDVTAVHGELRAVVQTLAAVNKQTGIAAKNAQMIDSLAKRSEVQAREARDSITMIKRLATENDALVESLSGYSEQVRGISRDVQKLSDAIQLLSLNAAIESNKPDGGTRRFEALVSEVGRLSLSARDASIKITALMRTIQSNLHQTRMSASSERRQAGEVLQIIDDALRSLENMSRDSVRIAASVTAISRSVAEQNASNEKILKHSTDVTRKAKASALEVTRLNALVSKQGENVRRNSSAMRQLATSIDKLNKLIGSKTHDNAHE